MAPTEGPAQAKSTGEKKTHEQFVGIQKLQSYHLSVASLKVVNKEFLIIKSLCRQQKSSQKSVKSTAAFCSSAKADKANFDICVVSVVIRIQMQ